MSEFFPQLQAHGLPAGCLDNGAGLAVANAVLELGGVGGTDKVIRRSRTTKREGSWPFGDLTEWWARADFKGGDTYQCTEVLKTATMLERAITDVMQQAQTTDGRLLRIRLIDRVLLLPEHQWPALRLNLPRPQQDEQ